MSKGRVLYPAKPQPNNPNTVTNSNIAPIDAPTGLANIGNTCFLNSIIQFLYAIRQLREGLIEKYGAHKNFDGSFSKLLGMMFSQLKGRKQQVLSQQKILYQMAKQLELINNDYKLHSQQDALQTLLNILNQIEVKHPKFIQNFNVEYRIQCQCCSFVINDRIISYSQSICTKCGEKIKRIFIQAPKYIIFSNQSHKKTEKEKQVMEISEIKSTYQQIARIIYIGDGKSGHYIAQRQENMKKQYLNDGKYTAQREVYSKWYQFNDRRVNFMNGKNNFMGNRLILLYEKCAKDLIIEQKIHKPQPQCKNEKLQSKRKNGEQPIYQKDSTNKTKQKSFNIKKIPNIDNKKENQMQKKLTKNNRKQIPENSYCKFLYQKESVNKRLIEQSVQPVYFIIRKKQSYPNKPLAPFIFFYLTNKSYKSFHFKQYDDLKKVSNQNQIKQLGKYLHELIQQQKLASSNKQILKYTFQKRQINYIQIKAFQSNLKEKPKDKQIYIIKAQYN